MLRVPCVYPVSRDAGRQCVLVQGRSGLCGTCETVETSDSDVTADGYPILQTLDRKRQLEAQGINS